MPSPASPGMNQFRCNACGRYFNDQQQLLDHQADCIPAKRATPEGARELDEQNRQPHKPNDVESKEHPFQHGTRKTA